MSYKTFIDYWNLITPIEAQGALLDLQVSSYSNMKPESQKKIYRELKQKAYSGYENETNKLKSIQEVALNFAKRLKGG